jgi:2,3-bisphosphoglycerate-dependent phosphoglycerate mutase
MHKVVLLRHGESTWNQENRFTGWTDVDLSPKGLLEAGQAGKLLKEEGFAFDVAYTSVLKRALRTCWIALDALDLLWIPVIKHWRLNERHYGALQGLDKKATTELHGAEQTHLWRRSYDVPPPPVPTDSPEHPINDPRYRRLPPDVLPASECLRDVVARVLPYWYDVVAPQLLAGLDVLITAHGNSLRALLKHLEHVSDAEIAEINIPTGAPRQYMFDDHLNVTSAAYLGDAAAVEAAAAAVARQAGT